jgi:hypothetical protein
MDENDVLLKKMKDISDQVTAKQTQIEGLMREELQEEMKKAMEWT